MIVGISTWDNKVNLMIVGISAWDNMVKVMIVELVPGILRLK